QAVLDMDDTVVRGMTVAQAGETLWPPPPVQVSAAPAAAPAGGATPVADKPVKKPMSQQRRFGLIVGLGLLFVLLSAWMPGAILGNFLIFMLSVVIGFYVIGNVHHALHTPLMSVTNAISGIIVVGALLQVGHGHLWVSILAFLGVLVASINIFGGFTVTDRMLDMFKREEPA
ncbi:proton-translocating transhydrogenase family protein, partial [Nostocoides australiense]|nr:proton-translocating transhydrogenase family protein [Tetrasphaera australiensis]